VLVGGSHFGVHGAKIDVPTPFADVVGVTDGISELRTLAADITNSCHNSVVLPGLLPNKISRAFAQVLTSGRGTPPPGWSIEINTLGGFVRQSIQNRMFIGKVLSGLGLTPLLLFCSLPYLKKPVDTLASPNTFN
jgi:hypothetical protein